jgi:hypothetical protein
MNILAAWAPSDSHMEFSDGGAVLLPQVHVECHMCKTTSKNRTGFAFGPSVNGIASLRGHIPGFVVDGPIWYSCASSWAYNAFYSIKNDEADIVVILIIQFNDHAD